jgi:hypothetical protein
VLLSRNRAVVLMVVAVAVLLSATGVGLGAAECCSSFRPTLGGDLCFANRFLHHPEQPLNGTLHLTAIRCMCHQQGAQDTCITPAASAAAAAWLV